MFQYKNNFDDEKVVTWQQTRASARPDKNGRVHDDSAAKRRITPLRSLISNVTAHNCFGFPQHHTILESPCVKMYLLFIYYFY